MPHLILDYSANLERRIDVSRLVTAVHEAALATGVFPKGGVRTRAHRHDVYRVADGDPENAYIHVVARIREGRDVETRRRAGEKIFHALCSELDVVYRSSPLAISFEIQEIHENVSFRKNNLHDRLMAKAEDR